MKALFTERNIVVVLFVTVLITFSLAQEDSKKMEKLYSGTATSSITKLVAQQMHIAKINTVVLPRK